MYFNFDGYFILLIMLLIGFFISFVMIFASFILGPHITNIEKVSAWESGPKIRRHHYNVHFLS